MKVLVVGGTGFLGRPLCEELTRRGHQLHGASEAEDSPQRLDVTDPKSCRQVLRHERYDVVVNLAGSGVTGGSSSSQTMAQINHQGAITLAEAILTVENPPWVVHAASSTEPTDARAAESEYSRTKAAGTLSLASILSRAQVPFIVARIHNTYGPSQPAGRFVTSTIHTLREGKVVQVRYRDRVRDFCHVDDVTEHLADLVERRQLARVYTEIGTGVGTTIWAAADTIRVILGAPEGSVVALDNDDPDPSHYQVADASGPGFLRCATPLELGLEDTIGRLS
ncbi:MAG: NAD(P)-dependent oxidoreductase [Actinomycetes bacterium]